MSHELQQSLEDLSWLSILPMLNLPTLLALFQNSYHVLKSGAVIPASEHYKCMRTSSAMLLPGYMFSLHVDGPQDPLQQIPSCCPKAVPFLSCRYMALASVARQFGSLLRQAGAGRCASSAPSVFDRM